MRRKGEFERVVPTLGIDGRYKARLSSRAAIRARKLAVFKPAYQKCSADFSAKVLICLCRTPELAQVGLTPDMNPIEKTFSTLKASLRKLAERTVAGLMRALDACADIFKPAERTNYFAARGYAATYRSLP